MSKPEAGLPFLPGYRPTRDPRRTDYRVKHVFDFKNSLPVVIEPSEPRDQAKPSTAPLLDEEALLRMTYGHAEAKRAPADPYVPHYVMYDKVVLRFSAFFEEAIVESPLEAKRKRNVLIDLYLVDGSIQITEPAVENSGIPQGPFLRRQVVNKTDGTPINHMDLLIGNDITIFGRQMHITGCIKSTREFLVSQGVEVPEDEPLPVDEVVEARIRDNQPRRPIKAKPADTLGKFLDHDREVLRFYATWDSRDELYGDLREFIVHYFLADDSVEIYEISVSDGISTPFMRRKPLPRDFTTVNQTSVHHLSIDPHEALRREREEYVRPTDLRIGEVLNVYNRLFFIHSCDAFTREWYEAAGAPQPEGGEGPKDHTRRIEVPSIEARIPPYTGFGSEEDSRNSCLSFEPKATRKDLAKWLLNDGKVLRFQAKLHNAAGFDRDRVFVISYYLSDDTVGVFEPPVRNSGIIGGKFLERQQISIGHDELQRPVYLSEHDFQLGETVSIFGHVFDVIDADAFTRERLGVPLTPLQLGLQQIAKTEDLIILEELRSQLAAVGVEYTDEEWTAQLEEWNVRPDSFVNPLELL